MNFMLNLKGNNSKNCIQLHILFCGMIEKLFMAFLIEPKKP